jgi:Polyketide cyclase / dehydrase and lipid transport
MARYVARVRTRRPREEVFAYMADLRNFAAWDPSVLGVAQVEGNGGGPGTVFDVTVRGRRDQVLRYRTVAFDPPHEVLVVAKTKTLRSKDRIVVDADGTGAIVTYDAVLRFTGLLRTGGGVLYFVLRRIGDRASAGLCQALEGEVLA